MGQEDLEQSGEEPGMVRLGYYVHVSGRKKAFCPEDGNLPKKDKESGQSEGESQ